MRQNERIFVDSGVWIALALTRDPLHKKALDLWEMALEDGARLFTSIPVVLETFTFLERNVSRDLALAWKDSLKELRGLTLLAVDETDLDAAWAYFKLRELHKLSAVDATSFVLMKKLRLRLAFSFDHHFASVGFRLLG